jgi:hypothetical protein
MAESERPPDAPHPAISLMLLKLEFVGFWTQRLFRSAPKAVAIGRARTLHDPSDGMHQNASKVKGAAV